MNEDYLWDQSGEPDPEIVRLEKLLGQFRLQPRAQRTSWRRYWSVPLAIAAAVLLAVILYPNHYATSWSVARTGAASQGLRSGDVVETGSTPATIASDLIGRVDVEPGSRVRIASSRNNQHRFNLELGTIHALIWAPPAQFIVQTPSAKAIDLGCQYTLQVSPDGSGTIQVETGWVAFESKGLESFIPAGAGCATHPGKGPGTPYFLDASTALRNALASFERDGDDPALQTVLAESRQRDALSLWHLLQRTQGSRRAAIAQRFASLTHLPDGTKEAMLRGDATAADTAWNALQLGDASFWRQWKRTW